MLCAEWTSAQDLMRRRDVHSSRFTLRCEGRRRRVVFVSWPQISIVARRRRRRFGAATTMFVRQRVRGTSFPITYQDQVSRSWLRESENIRGSLDVLRCNEQTANTAPPGHTGPSFCFSTAICAGGLVRDEKYCGALKHAGLYSSRMRCQELEVGPIHHIRARASSCCVTCVC